MKEGVDRKEVTHKMWEDSYAHDKVALSLLNRFSKRERRRFIRKKGKKNGIR